MAVAPEALKGLDTVWSVAIADAGKLTLDKLAKAARRWPAAVHKAWPKSLPRIQASFPLAHRLISTP